MVVFSFAFVLCNRWWFVASCYERNKPTKGNAFHFHCISCVCFGFFFFTRKRAFEYFTTISICICSQFALKLAFYATDTFTLHRLLYSKCFRDMKSKLHLHTYSHHYYPFSNAIMCPFSFFLCIFFCVLFFIGSVFFFFLIVEFMLDIDKKCIQIAMANINRLALFLFGYLNIRVQTRDIHIVWCECGKES